MCVQDISCTTAQTQQMIDRFTCNRIVGPGGLRILDILKSLWKHLVDTENMFDLLLRNTDAQGRRDLTYALTANRCAYDPLPLVPLLSHSSSALDCMRS